MLLSCLESRGKVMVTKSQIGTLKYLIYRARHGTVLMKRILFSLIDNSEGLTLPVSLCLIDGRGGFTSEEIHRAAVSLGAMNGHSGKVYLHELMDLSGSELHFSTHYGHYDDVSENLNTEGIFGERPGEKAPGHENDRGGMPMRYTFWLARKSYGHSGKGKLLTVTKEALEKIRVNRPGQDPEWEESQPYLYPEPTDEPLSPREVSSGV